MKKKIIIAIVLLSFSLLSLLYAEVEDLDGDSYPLFIKDSIRIVEFYSEDGDSLEQLETQLVGLAGENNDIEYGKVDVQANRDFVSSLKYKILPDKPTVVFFLNGELVNGFVGFPPSEKLADIVTAVVQQKKKQEALASGEIEFMDAYDFTLSNLEGESFTLSEVEGLIVLDFWATWCPPCKEEIPYLQKFHEKYKDKGLKIYGISSEPANVQRKFMTEQDEMGNKISYNLLVDVDKAVSKKYGIRSIPTTYFISSEGKLLKKETGFAPEFADEYENIIEKNLPQE